MMPAGLLFLIFLLLGLVYLNRHVFGITSGCNWQSSDELVPGQPRKWMCNIHGTIIEMAEGEVPRGKCEDLMER